MVESLKDLNEKCQKSNYKTKGNWMVRTFIRDLALPITWVLLHTPITANQVTLIALFVGILGSVLLLGTSLSAYVIAILLLQLWYLLDHVDGQIARYYGKACISGRYFDFLMHHIIHAIIPFFMSFFLYAQSDWLGWLFIGFIASASSFLFNMIYDIRAKAILEVFDSCKSVEILHRDSNPSESDKNSTPRTTRILSRRFFSMLHKSFEIHVLINVLLVSCLFQWATSWDSRPVIFFYYLIIPWLLCITKNFHIIHNRKIDAYLSEKYQISSSLNG